MRRQTLTITTFVTLLTIGLMASSACGDDDDPSEPPPTAQATQTATKTPTGASSPSAPAGSSTPVSSPTPSPTSGAAPSTCPADAAVCDEVRAMIQVFRNRDSAAIVEASGNSWGEDIVAGSLANAFGSGEPQVVSIGCPVDEAHPEGECSDAFVIAFASDTPGRLSAFGFLRQEGEVELLTGMYTVEGDAAIIVQEGGVPGRECISGRIPKTDEDCQQSYFYPWIGD